jgi:hypothetical protein
MMDICIGQLRFMSCDQSTNVQELLQKQDLKVVNQGVSDVGRSAVLEHVLPEGQVRQKGHEVILEIFAKEALRLWV